MIYEFPTIQHYNQVSHLIDGENFFVKDVDGYKIVNYRFSDPNTFPEEFHRDAFLVREFRGIIFSPCGNVVRRPYHKFFNYGEKEDTLDDYGAYHVLEKLDGSMIAPYMFKDRLVFGTKMGDTDVSKQLDDFLVINPQYIKFSIECIQDGYTPIFEWCSRQQRIVIDYPEDRLVLTAIRNIESGKYVSYDNLLKLSREDDIELIKSFPVNRNIEDLKKFIEQHSGNMEGIVIRNNDGHMMKLKDAGYVLRHKTKELISCKRYLTSAILADYLDDVHPLLTIDDQTYVKEFSQLIKNNMHVASNKINVLLDKSRNMTRKEFALSVKEDIDAQIFMPIVWKIIDNDYTDVRGHLTKYILLNCSSSKNFEKVHRILGL